MGKYVHRHFESSQEFWRWCESEDIAKKADGRGGFTREVGKVREGMRVLHEGDERFVGEAQKLLGEFNEQISISSTRMDLAVVGFMPCVQAYLEGSPEDMWVREDVRSELTPIRVWVSLVASSMISERDIRKRGVGLAAFALAMVEKRPVVITPYVCLDVPGSGLDGCYISWDVQTSPLVLSELLGVFNLCVTRYVGLASCYTLEPRCGNGPAQMFTNEKMAREGLGVEEDDVVLVGLSGVDRLVSDPVGWVREKVRKYGRGDE
jgi:hypothetical protein